MYIKYATKSISKRIDYSGRTYEYKRTVVRGLPAIAYSPQVFTREVIKIQKHYRAWTVSFAFSPQVFT